MKYKQCAPNSIEYSTHKHNLGVFNGILKIIIREAKILHYDKLFHKYRSDMKMTWKTISEVVCKSNRKRLELEKIIVDAKTITNKIEICNEFNKFFTNIGPKLAGKINTENKECYQNYFKNRILTSFAFDFVDESIVTKHISTLCTKKLLRPWWNLHEITKIPFTSCDKASGDCDKSIFGHWYFSGKIENS